MIQIYSPSNADYSKNGDRVIQPSYCKIEAKLNGTWDMELEHPIDDDEIWKLIQEGAVISAPTFVGKNQLFRIYNKIKTDIDVKAYARPIFMDSASEVFLVDTRPTIKNGQGAINEILGGQSKYSGISDITKVSTAYYVRKNAIEAIQSNDDQSFLNRWGGEILYDNYTIRVNARVGGDYGVRAEFGNNLIGIEEDINMDNVVTRIIPVAYNGHMLSGSEPWVNSPNINKYPIVYAREIKFDDVKMAEDAQEGETGYATLVELQAELIRRCNAQFEAGIDLPECNYKVEMLDLSKTEEYKDVKTLEKVGLGDTIHCKNKRLDIVTDARVIGISWDCIDNIAESVELGEFTYNYFNNLTSAMSKIDEVVDKYGNIDAERVAGIIDGMKATLKVQNTVAVKQQARAILFEDLDPASEMFGAMSLGTQGFEIAHERTIDGREWNWTTAVTGRGILATCVIAGLLSSANYNGKDQGFCLNLDNGTIDSKNLKLDASGMLTILKATITGGEIMINNGADIPVPLFVVNENGWGLGLNGEDIRYLNSDGYVEINGNLHMSSGKIIGYKDGNKGIEIGNCEIKFYAWNDLGNYVGSIASVKRDSDNRTGISMHCDSGDYLSLGYKNSNSDNLTYSKIRIDSNSPDGPPWIKGGANGSPSFISGLAWSNGNITRVDRTTLTITSGIITGWNSESTYY